MILVDREALLDGKILILEPLAVVQGRQRLLGSGNQVLISRLVFALGDLVEFLVELLQLSSLGHEIAKHELRGLVGSVALVEQEFETVVDQSEVEEETVSSQAVATVANNLDTALGVVSIEASQHFVVREATRSLPLNVLGSPCPDQLVVCL